MLTPEQQAIRALHARLGDRWWEREHSWDAARDLVSHLVSAAGHSPRSAVVTVLRTAEALSRLPGDRELARCRERLTGTVESTGNVRRAAERYYVECYGHIGTTDPAQKSWRAWLVALYRGCEMLGLDVSRLPAEVA